jgi:hypothetical protein
MSASLTAAMASITLALCMVVLILRARCLMASLVSNRAFTSSKQLATVDTPCCIHFIVSDTCDALLFTDRYTFAAAAISLRTDASWAVCCWCACDNTYVVKLFEYITMIDAARNVPHIHNTECVKH